jgi:hypothetical protein
MSPLGRFHRKSLTLRQVEDIMSTLPQDGKEHGFVICDRGTGRGEDRLVRGPESSGHTYGVNVDVSCPIGSKPICLWHTHPKTGNINPSEADMKAAKDNKIPWLCVAIPETGESRCYPVPGV